MTRIENHTPRRRVPWLALLIAIGWLLLIAGWCHTVTCFTPRATQISLDLADMQDRIDAMLEEVEAMRP